MVVQLPRLDEAANRPPRCPLIQQAKDTVYEALVLSQRPLAVLLSLFFVTFLAVSMGSFAVDSARSCLSSVCDLPLVSHSPLCTSDIQVPPSTVAHIDYPALAHVQNALLDELVDHSGSGIELALNIKHAELAVRDLAGVVRASNMSVKDALVDSLGRFVVDAQVTGQYLQRLSAKALGTIDSISAFNLYAFQIIRASVEKGNHQTNVILARTFQTSMDTLASQIARVLVAATEAAARLQQLEETLSLVHELCARESLLQHVALDEVLSSIWTLLGGNRNRLRDLKYRAVSLQEVQRFRTMAVAYVAATTQALRAADAELAELRDRLMDASTTTEDIPIEVHLASIERTLARVKGVGSLAGGGRVNDRVVRKASS
ncbi:hypothetical protein PYCCODRAFT_1467314 [Trametes coccinea BRFM310]|uniref:Uncharacterized protein n=1 Tax=Trametes coccinea (strain BRFM310) TaxID=1353009 RepID=A0A1Y2IPG1_TRAC3|nr:hypothetical protein PYCCODRAFT_1467314 [Trametes coccinea BRFM310]